MPSAGSGSTTGPGADSAVHQLRQAPDVPDALSLPLPLHLAGLAQEYALPTRAEGEEEPTTDTAEDADPDTATPPGLATEPEPERRGRQANRCATDRTAGCVLQLDRAPRSGTGPAGGRRPVRAPSPPASGSPRTPRGASSGRSRTPGA
ncbi:RNaseH domain-containing protein [Streptomyces syringium]|uniref:RNaseH domain-containing protein n=1 Tax=Streptomyces syringium TaxID=76729 RepID=UPI003AAF2A6D